MRRLVFLIGLTFWITACVAPSVPDAPMPLPVSPLLVPHPSMQAMSPLPSPGRVGAPTIVIMSRSYVPLVQGGMILAEDGCSLNATAAWMLKLIREAIWQERIGAMCHPLLAIAADNKVRDMAKYEYVSHVSHDGLSSNDIVRAAGFELPPWFMDGENNVESVAGGWGYSTAEIVIAAWQTSLLHWRHLSGNDPFFAAQTCIAVGYANTPGVGFQHYWAFYSAPCP